jgi:chromosome segregation ATPase
VIAAAWIDSSSRSKLKSFLSTEADDELSLKVKQPQATTSNYENHSTSIVSTLEDMKDKAEATLNSLRREEMQAKHAFEMIKQSLSDAITNLSKEIDESQAQSGAAQEKLAKAQGNLASTDAARRRTRSTCRTCPRSAAPRPRSGTSARCPRAARSRR